MEAEKPSSAYHLYLSSESELITHRHTHVDELKINTPAEAVCIHAIPRVCTITEEVNLIKGQRMQAGRFLAAQSDLQDGEQGDLDHCCAANIQHLIVLLSLSVVDQNVTL